MGWRVVSNFVWGSVTAALGVGLATTTFLLTQGHRQGTEAQQILQLAHDVAELSEDVDALHQRNATVGFDMQDLQAERLREAELLERLTSNVELVFKDFETAMRLVVRDVEDLCNRQRVRDAEQGLEPYNNCAAVREALAGLEVTITD